jgi:hypothetical protein
LWEKNKNRIIDHVGVQVVQVQLELAGDREAAEELFERAREAADRELFGHDVENSDPSRQNLRQLDKQLRTIDNKKLRAIDEQLRAIDSQVRRLETRRPILCQKFDQPCRRRRLTSPHAPVRRSNAIDSRRKLLPADRSADRRQKLDNLFEAAGHDEHQRFLVGVSGRKGDEVSISRTSVSDRNFVRHIFNLHFLQLLFFTCLHT